MHGVCGEVRGVGLEPTEAFATGSPIFALFYQILSPAPLAYLGNPRIMN